MTKKRNLHQRSNPEGIRIGDLVTNAGFDRKEERIGVVLDLDFTSANVYEKEQTDAVIYWCGEAAFKKSRIDAVYLEKISL